MAARSSFAVLDYQREYLAVVHGFVSEVQKTMIVCQSLAEFKTGGLNAAAVDVAIKSGSYVCASCSPRAG